MYKINVSTKCDILESMSRKTTSVRNEFRTNNADPRGHPVYVFAQVGHDLIYFVITHSAKFDGVVPFRINPNPSDNKETSFYVPIPQRLRVDNFGRVRKGWKICEEDLEYMKQYMKIPKKCTKNYK